MSTAHHTALVDEIAAGINGDAGASLRAGMIAAMMATFLYLAGVL